MYEVDGREDFESKGSPPTRAELLCPHSGKDKLEEQTEVFDYFGE